MKNEHLIPIAVKDIAENMNNNWTKRIDKEYHAMRLETIRDFCEQVLTAYNKNKNKNTFK